MKRAYGSAKAAVYPGVLREKRSYFACFATSLPVSRFDVTPGPDSIEAIVSEVLESAGEAFLSVNVII